MREPMTETHYETAIRLWGQLKVDALEFGRETLLAIQTEGKTIRQMSIDLCGNASLEDKIGRYVMAAKFNDSISSASYGQIKEWLSPSHYTELQKVEDAFDRETALEIMQDIVTENPDETMNVKPVDYIRAKRMELQGGPSLDEKKHQIWKKAANLLNDLYSDLERKGALATKQDRRLLRLVKLFLAAFQAEVTFQYKI